MGLIIQDFKIYKSQQKILDIPYLELPSTPITVIWGPNGAGKTSLLRCMVSLDSYRGHIEWQDYKKTKKPTQLYSWIPSQCHLAFDTTVKDFLLYSRYQHHRGFIRRKDIQIVDQVLERMKLSSLGKRNVSALSSGEWQKIQIARGIASQAQILILDEPCAHLDIGARYELMQLLKETTQDMNCKVFMTSHDLFIVPQFIDYSIAIKHGSILYHHPKALSSQEVAHLFDLSHEKS